MGGDRELRNKNWTRKAKTFESKGESPRRLNRKQSRITQQLQPFSKKRNKWVNREEKCREGGPGGGGVVKQRGNGPAVIRNSELMRAKNRAERP